MLDANKIFIPEGYMKRICIISVFALILVTIFGGAATVSAEVTKASINSITVTPIFAQKSSVIYYAVKFTVTTKGLANNSNIKLQWYMDGKEIGAHKGKIRSNSFVYTSVGDELSTKAFVAGKYYLVVSACDAKVSVSSSLFAITGGPGKVVDFTVANSEVQITTRIDKNNSNDGYKRLVIKPTYTLGALQRYSVSIDDAWGNMKTHYDLQAKLSTMSNTELKGIEKGVTLRKGKYVIHLWDAFGNKIRDCKISL